MLNDSNTLKLSCVINLHKTLCPRKIVNLISKFNVSRIRHFNNDSKIHFFARRTRTEKLSGFSNSNNSNNEGGDYDRDTKD